MDLRKIFINKFGRLRSGWRLLLFVFAFIAISFLLSTALRIVYVLLHTVPPVPHAEFFSDIIFRLSLLFSAVSAGYLCARLIEDLPWRSLGITIHEGCFRDFLFGLVLGTASLGLAVGIAALAGGLRFSAPGTEMIWSLGRSLLSSAVLLFMAAFAEEATFRGYPLQTFARARLAWVGVLLTSVPFATVHLSNPNVVPGVTFINTALAGIWLAVAYLRTRSIWLPLAIHWSWNWALGWIFGLPISGITLVSHPLLKGEDLGPAWLTGGSYGIEGGAACTVALIVSTVILWRVPWLSPTPELEKLTSEENPAIPSPRISIRPTVDNA
jgi:CAAX protease family protein